MRSLAVAVGLTVVAVLGGATGAKAETSSAISAEVGILSGNLIQIPVHIPINVCGNTVSVLGSHNSADDNVCVND